jgi:ABC-type Fe3+-hydroxamate transport system substrate-binding protein
VTAATRVVSLVPSVTETLTALGCPPIACTRFCERPDLPTVGGTKNPDIDAIVSLAPDVVTMNDEENRRVDYDALIAAGLRVVDVSPRSVADVGESVRLLADLVDAATPDPFEHWNGWLTTRAPTVDRGRVVALVWRRPWMALGPDTYGASMLAALGFTNAVAGDERYPTTTLEELACLALDAVLLPSEPYTFSDRHRMEVAEVVDRAAVVLVDGQDLFWWGIRTPQALTRLAARLP